MDFFFFFFFVIVETEQDLAENLRLNKYTLSNICQYSQVRKKTSSQARVPMFMPLPSI